MAQKINPLVFRLKKRFGWNATFSVHNALNFSKIYNSNEQLQFSTTKLFYNFNIIPNNFKIISSARSVEIFSKLWQKQFLLNNLFPVHSSHSISLIARRKSVIVEKERSIFLTRNKYNFQFCDLFFNSKYSLLSNNVLHPKIFTAFLASQFNKGLAIRNPLFLFNFKAATLFVVKRVLQKFKNDILGLKLTCSGKWKKTRSGRKQKFTVQFGLIKNSGISNVIFFDQLAHKTKFGSCNFKIWILLKKQL